MTQYIDKAAVVAEIEKLYQQHSSKEYIDEGGVVLEQLEDFLDTLEAKEVHLDFQRFAKEMDFVFDLPSSETKNTEEEPLNWEYVIAKHFFELGMSVSNKQN